MKSKKRFVISAGDRRMKEISASMDRTDLRPPVLSDGGFSLEDHCRTLSSTEAIKLDLPLERPTIKSTAGNQALKK